MFYGDEALKECPMSPGLIAMALLGCSDAGDQCQTLRVLPARYATVAECYAASNEVLVRLSDNPAPMMAVRCRKVAGETAPVTLASN